MSRPDRTGNIRQSLEVVLPPLSLAWLSTAWIAGNVTESDAATVVGKITTLLCMHVCKTHMYAWDAAVLTARVLLKTELTVAIPPLVLPPVIGGSPVAVPPGTNLALARSIATNTYDRNCLSYFMFIYALPIARAVPTNELPVANGVGTLERVIAAFAGECKWKEVGDMYLHGLINLTMPAWVTASLGQTETPWALFSTCHASDANGVGRQFISKSAKELLTALTGLDLFVLLASFVLELTGKPTRLHLNTQLLHIAADAPPTLCVVRDFAVGTLDRVGGYMHAGTFHTHANPYVVLCRWTEASAAVPGRSSLLRHLNEFCGDDRAPSVDNPFNKLV
jgi:hypothetical protein